MVPIYKPTDKVFCYFTEQEANNKRIVVRGLGSQNTPSAVIANHQAEAVKKFEDLAAASYGAEMTLTELFKKARSVMFISYDWYYTI